MRPRLVLFHTVVLLLSTRLCVAAQQPEPIPDITTLMHQVEQHQRAAEQVRKKYLYHSIQVQQELDNKGSIKKTETVETEILFIEGVQVSRIIRKNGRDLTQKEQKKEEEDLDKEVAKAKEKKAKAEREGKDTTANGEEIITVSRFLELGQFTAPRREQIDGRSTILLDYTGDPHAKSHGMAENIIRNLAGTIWIDEEDRAIRRIQGHFLDNFKVGAGLLFSVKKDTRFEIQNLRVNNEIWLPTHAEGEGSVRAFLFVNFNGRFRADFSGYRRFQTTTIILPLDSAPEKNSTPQQPQ